MDDQKARIERVEVTRVIYDDEVYFVLPSGFVGRVIVVREDPVGFNIRHEEEYVVKQWLENMSK